MVMDFAKTKRIPVFIDPKLMNFENYSGATLFKPNKKETEAGLRVKLQNKNDVINAGNKIMKDFNIENVLITLGADGMMLFEKNGDITSVPTIARKIADVSGAGDTAIATFATMYVAGTSLAEAAMIANFASGIVCEKPGIVAIEKSELIEVCKKNELK
jgi:rfaE bifunctional protein kinase chain/domain